MYCLSSANAQSIEDLMKDAFLRFQIPLRKLRGQCYNGCSTMAGEKTGVYGSQNHSSGIRTHTVFKHYYGHTLNLDTFKHTVIILWL